MLNSNVKNAGHMILKALNSSECVQRCYAVVIETNSCKIQCVRGGFLSSFYQGLLFPNLLYKQKAGLLLESLRKVSKAGCANPAKRPAVKPQGLQLVPYYTNPAITW